MGSSIIKWYRERVKSSWKTAVISVFLIGLFAHAYKFTNTLPNHDALYSVYSSMNLVGSGRWFLAAACAPSSFFDLPWVNGLLSLLWIGLTAAAITDIFQIRNPFVIVLTSGILVTFPSVTNTFFFEFTADGYMLAMLLAALTVRFSMVGDDRKNHIVLSMLFVCLSCGIYQAYVSFALLLAMCHYIWELLCGVHDKKAYLKWIARQFIVYGGGMAAYWITWKLCLWLERASVTDYQGLTQLGLSVENILGMLKGTVVTIGQFLLGWNVAEHGWTVYAVMNVLLLLCLAAALVTAVVKSRLYRSPLYLFLVIISVGIMPFFACIFMLVSQGVFYHALMLQSLSVLYIFTALLCDKFWGARQSTVAGVFLAALVFKFALQANICYFEMDKCCERSFAEATEMLTRIHMVDGGEGERIAFIGGGDQSLALVNPPEAAEIMVHAHQIRPTLLYNHTYASLYFVSIMDSGYAPASQEEIAALMMNEQVKEMDVWPAEDSVIMVGDTVVLRLPDPGESSE